MSEILLITNPGGPHIAHKHIIDVLSDFGNLHIIKIGKTNLVQSLYKVKRCGKNTDIVFFEDITLSKILNILRLKGMKLGLAADRLIYASLFKPKWYLKDGLFIKSMYPLYYYKYIDYDLTKNGIKKLNYIFAVSPLMQKIITKINKNVFIIRPTATYQNYYTKNINYYYEKDENLILSISRGGSFKGVDLLLKAFIYAKRKYSKLKLILLGNKVDLINNHLDLLKYVTTRYSRDVKILLRYIPDDDLINYYRRSSIYLQTSYFDPCPIAVFDAIIFENIPIVTQYVGSKDFTMDDFISDLKPEYILQKIDYLMELSDSEKRKRIKRMKTKIPKVFYNNQKRKFKVYLKNLI